MQSRGPAGGPRRTCASTREEQSADASPHLPAEQNPRNKSQRWPQEPQMMRNHRDFPTKNDQPARSRLAASWPRTWLARGVGETRPWPTPAPGPTHGRSARGCASGGLLAAMGSPDTDGRSECGPALAGVSAAFARGLGRSPAWTVVPRGGLTCACGIIPRSHAVPAVVWVRVARGACCVPAHDATNPVALRMPAHALAGIP